MRIKGSTVQGIEPWVRVQCSPAEVLWHINPVKRWLYRHIVNDLNKWLWKRYEKEIEL